MAEYLGEKDISAAIFSATEQVINENKYVTYDLGGSATLSEMTDRIALLGANNLKK
jgi:isocitrate dehydrogenase